MNRKKGFTLIELLIVIAIVAILSAVAFPAYQDFIKAANMTKVNAQFEQAIRATESAMVRGATQRAMGLTATTPATATDWITLYNPDSKTAPGGGAAFAAAADDTTGAIGVSQAGSGISQEVTLTLPAYEDLTGMSEVVKAADVQ